MGAFSLSTTPVHLPGGKGHVEREGLREKPRAKGLWCPAWEWGRPNPAAQPSECSPPREPAGSSGTETQRIAIFVSSHEVLGWCVMQPQITNTRLSYPQCQSAPLARKKTSKCVHIITLFLIVPSTIFFFLQSILAFWVVSELYKHRSTLHVL